MSRCDHIQARIQPTCRSIDNSFRSRFNVLDGILVRLRVHKFVFEVTNNFDRATQVSLAKRSLRDSVVVRNDNPITSEMSNRLVFGDGASGAFHSAHDFAINNSTLNDVQGNYVSHRFVAGVYHHH